MSWKSKRFDPNPKSMKTILITGGAGFIGTHTMVQLLNEGFKVSIIDNHDNSIIEAIDRVKKLVGPELSKKLQFNLESKFFSIFYSKDETFVDDLRNRDDLDKLFSKTKYCQLNIYCLMSSYILLPLRLLRRVSVTLVSNGLLGSPMIELQYLHEYARISSSIGLTAKPIVNFSSVLRTNVLTLGIDISFDTKVWNFTKCNTGLSFTNADLIAFLAFHVVMNEKGDSVNASYYHIVNPLTNIVVGVEVTHRFSSNVNTVTMGTQHALDPLTTIKAPVNNADKASTLIQHEWSPKSLFTNFREVDTKSIDKSPKVKLALTLKL
ncbi:hypothetical protein PVK06_001732 [Gossypium arboreum]|uniref:NAD(P)-binding domain-containing protein n=1 Tax=Gossypium arboreum TaxID=29729 RepID=A0ABR0R2V2_GOSAR|nr:hypothetical protein PVK06_001732 [Gossypium arboreum]